MSTGYWGAVFGLVRGCSPRFPTVIRLAIRHTILMTVASVLTVHQLEKRDPEDIH